MKFGLRYLFNYNLVILGPDIDSPEGRMKLLGMDPSHKEAASQTQDLDKEDSEEDDDVEKELPPTTRSHPVSDSAPSRIDGHKVKQVSGEVAGNVPSKNQNPSSVTADGTNQLKTEKNSNVDRQSDQARETDAALDQNPRDTVTTTVENHGTYYETIC